MLFVAFPPETDRLRRTTIYRFDAQANQQLAISQLALGTGAKDDRWRPAERTQAPSWNKKFASEISYKTRFGA